MKKIIVLILLIILAIELCVIGFKFTVKNASFCSQEPCDEFMLEGKLVRINWQEFEEKALGENERLTPNKVTMTSDLYEEMPKIKININSYGFRGEEPELQKPAIELFGDSFIYGLGLKEEDTISFKLQELLPDFEVLNLGRNADNTEMMIERYNKLGKQFNPEIIILSYFQNDVEARNIPDKIFNFCNKSFKSRFVSECEHSLHDKYFQFLGRKDTRKLLEERVFSKFEPFLNSSDFKVIFLIFPTYEEEEIIFSEFLFGEKAIFLSNFGYNYEDPWILTSDDEHPSPYATSRIAELLSEEIR